MSAMVILEHLDLNQTYTVSAEDLNLDGNGPDFEQGETFVGRDLFKVMLLESSNDATSVFVTAVHRQNLDFVQLMNEKARALGMKHTVFAEAQGLNDHDTLSTASDVAILLRAASAIPEMREILTTAKADVTDVSGKVRHVVSTNQLLDVIPHIVIGKTGNTPGALGTMALEVGVNTHDDGLIAVVLGSSDRFGDMQKLISFGMRAHQWNP